MNTKRLSIVCLAISLAGLAITATLMLVRGQSVHASPGIRYVAPGGICGISPCHSTVQAAVDAAASDDEIRVAAGTYTGVSARAGITQAVYISKTLTIRGGYTTTNWTTPDPVANPTTLDAQEQGRVLYIAGDISPTIEGLRITSGDATGLGGWPPGATPVVGCMSSPPRPPSATARCSATPSLAVAAGFPW